MTEQDIIKIDLSKKGLLEKYVILKKDEKGYYIEYAFTEGAPHDNRCLSWYDSYQENAYIRNGWVKDLTNEDDIRYLERIKSNREGRVGKLFRLTSFTCGHEEYPESSLEDCEKSWKEIHEDSPFIPEDHICRVGCPAKRCRKTQCKGWTYEEPVKCACWSLKEETTMEEFIKNYKVSIYVSDLLSLPSIDKFNLITIL